MLKHYHWLGISKQGEKQSGSHVAESTHQLRTMLLQNGIYPLKIRPLHSHILRSSSSVLKPHELAHFIEQLATLVNAGITLVKALEIIATDSRQHHLAALANNIKTSILQGNPVPQAFRAFPHYFDDVTCSLLHIGEECGALDTILLELASHWQQELKYRSALKKALWYPLLLLGTTVLIGLIFLIFILPQFERTFTSFMATLPRYTQWIITMSHHLKNGSPIFLVSIFGVVLGSKILYQRHLRFKFYLEKLALATPLIGTLIQTANTMRLTQCLGLMLRSGITLIKALELTTTALTNYHYSHLTQQVQQALLQGETVQSAFNTHRILPQQVTQLIALGEETGTLDVQLLKIARIYTTKFENLMENIKSRLEPIAVLIIGVIVGSLVIALYLPIFRLGMLV